MHVSPNQLRTGNPDEFTVDVVSTFQPRKSVSITDLLLPLPRLGLELGLVWVRIRVSLG